MQIRRRDVEEARAHIPGTQEVLDIVRENCWDWNWTERGLLPVLDGHEANFAAIHILNPLAFRVAYLPHDDGDRVIYRNLESFLEAFLTAVDRKEIADSFLSETIGDYPPDGQRTPDDARAARKLLATPTTTATWCAAIQLLDPADLDEWARVLETEHCIRRDARARMAKITSPGIAELLQKDSEAFVKFADQIRAAATNSRLNVGPLDGNDLCLGKDWMNLDIFFYRRNIRDAIPRLLNWFEDVLARRDPYQRPGHFMMD